MNLTANSISSARDTLASEPCHGPNTPDTKDQAIETPAFQALREELQIAIGAGEIAEKTLLGLCQRLGVEPMFATSEHVEDSANADEISSTQRYAHRVTDIARAVRGLAETLERRL